VPHMNILNVKLIYTVLLCTVTAMAAIWMIPPLLRELGYHSAGIALKPLWFAGKSNNHRDLRPWNRLRFYNHRRAYAGEHRGVKW
jgi:hypothetical protein